MHSSSGHYPLFAPGQKRGQGAERGWLRWLCCCWRGGLPRTMSFCLVFCTLLLLSTTFFLRPSFRRTMRWAKGRLRESPTAAALFPTSWVMGTARPPSNMLDSVLDSCRPGLEEHLFASSTSSSSTAELDDSHPWSDAGELFYDPPALDAVSTLPRPSGDIPIPVSQLPVYSISCVGHGPSEERLVRQRKSLLSEAIGKESAHTVIPCERLRGVDQDCLLASGLFRRSGLRKGEAGVAIAHIRAWQQALKNAIAARIGGVGGGEGRRRTRGTGSSRGVGGREDDKIDVIPSSSSPASSSMDPPALEDSPIWWDHALFLEDDARFVPGSGVLLQQILEGIAKSTNTPIDMVTVWNGDWLWNTERQRSIDVKGGVEQELPPSPSSSSPSSSFSPRSHTFPSIYEANGTEPYIPGGVAYILSLSQIQKLLDHSFPIDKPLDALFSTGSKERGHFLLSPAEPRVIDKRMPRGSAIVATGDDGVSFNTA